MAKAVLDASAVLAYINGEPGAEIVAPVIGDALVSAVNLAEIVTKLVARTGSLALARTTLGIATFDVIDFDRALAERAGEFVSSARPEGLSLGDRACLALAERQGLPVLTADRAWASLKVGIDIRPIR
ncbi:MAG: type II toxin-antitoxin system VapC family toxin [Xanthobacteraceae bacterium]